jgi:hypothetical protein
VRKTGLFVARHFAFAEILRIMKKKGAFWRFGDAPLHAVLCQDPAFQACLESAS